MLGKYEILSRTIGSMDKYCEGIWNCRDNCYLLGVQLAAVKTARRFGHSGSSKLDEINSFDLAEVARANCGQINMITVSSFCGPKGLIWGYDIFPGAKIRHPLDGKFQDRYISIYDIMGLVRALEKLLGRIESPHFPFYPGSHIPCASKNISAHGPAMIYAAEGLAVPYDRQRNACLLMEDIGHIPLSVKDIDDYKMMILSKLVSSILQIGINQRVDYKEIFIGLNAVSVAAGEVGCAIALSPYFSVARDAIPGEIDAFSINIGQWESLVCNKFIEKNAAIQ